MNDESLIETIVSKLIPILQKYDYQNIPTTFKSIRKLNSFIINFIQLNKHKLNKFDMIVLKTCSQDIKLYTVRKQLFKLQLERKTIQTRNLIEYYNKINNSYFDELGYPKPLYIIESKRIYTCKKTKLQKMTDYFWLCNITIDSEEFKTNYKSMLNVTKNTYNNDLGYQIYKYMNKKPANMSNDEYSEHWTKLKDAYGGVVNYIRSLSNERIIDVRQSKLKVKMFTLYNYLYKNKHRDMLYIVEKIHHNPKPEDMEYYVDKLSKFIDKNNVYEKLVESTVFTRKVCKLIYILKKNGSRNIKTKHRTKHRKTKV